MPRRNKPTHAFKPITSEIKNRIAKVIELMRPAIQADGGDIELVSISPQGEVAIRFHGACVGCPSSDITLSMGIEQNLRAHVPEVVRVFVVE